MKTNYSGIALAWLVATLLLTACGGGGESAPTGGGASSYIAGGSTSGLIGSIVLQDNGNDNLTVSTNGSFTFATKVPSGSTYNVTIITQPTGQTCTVSNGSGIISGNITNVALSCSNNSYTVGGTLTGLAVGNSIFLANKGASNLALNADGPFTFPTSLANGDVYNLTILTTAPAIQSCTQSYGVGTIAAANVTSINVICSPPTAVNLNSVCLDNVLSQDTHTLLPSGMVLYAGGFTGLNTPLASADLCDPVTNTTTPTNGLVMGRYSHTATLLANGKVLVAGGFGALYINGSVATAELYDTATASWTATGSLTTPRSLHTATLLPDGRVLVVGGIWGQINIYGLHGTDVASAELYDPSTGIWTVTGSLGTARYSHTATLLANGKVLVTGGISSQSLYLHNEQYDPVTGNWTVVP